VTPTVKNTLLGNDLTIIEPGEEHEMLDGYRKVTVKYWNTD
jgi:hypothetical protein